MQRSLRIPPSVKRFSIRHHYCFAQIGNRNGERPSWLRALEIDRCLAANVLKSQDQP
jgi:hypothetical protein